MNIAKKIHNDSIVVDATGPLAVLDEYHQNYMQGGVTVVAATVGYGSSDLGSLDATVKNLKSWIDKFKDDSKKLLHVTSIDDIFRAKRKENWGLYFIFRAVLLLRAISIILNSIIGWVFECPSCVITPWIW